MNVTCKICGEEFDRLASHVYRAHGQKYEDYLVQHEFCGIHPKCGCGCGEDTIFSKSHGMSFKKYVRGHHARGRIKSDEEKRKIGTANVRNMKRYWDEHPELKEERAKQLRAGRTPEVEARRIAASTRTWQENAELKIAASNHAQKLWKDGTLKKARAKAARTWKKRYDTGEIVVNRQKISESVTNKYLQGGFEWSRGIHVSTKTGRSYYYRSSWELKHMRALDADATVTSWQYEPFKLKYVWDGVERNYIPDFIVTFSDGHRELQEVGVKTVKSLPRMVAKETAAREWVAEQLNTTYRLVTF